MGKKIGVFLLLVSFGMIAFGLYLYYFNPKKVMLEALSKEISDINYSNIKIGKLKFLTKTSLSYGSDKYDDEGELYLDSDQVKMYLKNNYKANDDVSSIIELFLENNKLFFNIKDISDKLNYIEITTNAEKIHIPKSEIKALITVVGQEIINNLPEESFSSKSENIVINKNHFDSKKYKVTLTLDDYYNIVTSVFNSIDKNPNLSTIKSIVFTDDKYDKVHLNTASYHADLKKIIIGEEDENKTFLNYSVYLFKNKTVLKHELSFKMQGEDGESIVKVSYASIDKGNDLSDYELVLQKENKNLFEITIDQQKESSKITCMLQDISLTGTLEKDNESRILKLDVLDNEKNKLGTVSGEYKEVRANEEYKLTLSANATIKNKSLLLSSESTILKDQEVPKFGVAGAQKFNTNNNNIVEIIKGKITKARSIKKLTTEANLTAFKVATFAVLNNAITCNALKPAGEVCTATEIKKYDTDTLSTYDISLASSVNGNVITNFKFSRGGYTLDLTGGDKCTIDLAKTKITALKIDDGNSLSIKCE